MMKQHKHKQNGEDGVCFNLHLVVSLVHQPGKSEQKPRDGNWSRGHGEVLLTGSTVAYSACFPIIPRIRTSWEAPPPTASWSLPYQASIKEMHHRTISWDIFSVGVPLLNDSGMYEIDISLASTTLILNAGCSGTLLYSQCWGYR